MNQKTTKEMSYIPLPEVETKKYGLLGYFNAFVKPLISLEPAKKGRALVEHCYAHKIELSKCNICES